ncbi:MAG: D-aminoacyl-tRNA deacylase [Candidatus Eisenbacteria bacterium]|nr:D-aminoacyl-tRNA deacylase [Candidatus Eisenbacteria bacterium]
MRALIQRVARASVTAGDHHAAIGPGLLIFLGVRRGDTVADAVWLAKKCAGLRIFEDDAGRMNRGLLEIDGEALVVSQFTLYGDADRGRRPSFVLAAPPEEANRLYEEFVIALRAEGVRQVGTGVFQAMMSVELVNDGPVTVMVESRPGMSTSSWQGPAGGAAVTAGCGDSAAQDSVQAELGGPVSDTDTRNPAQAGSAGLFAAESARTALARHLLSCPDPLVLASASPRRTEILARAGISHITAPVHADESTPPDQPPLMAAGTIARRKAMAAASTWVGRWILAADTIVDSAGQAFGKPVDDDDARAMLGQLSGREHWVHTGLALVSPGGVLFSGVESTRVIFRDLMPEEIEHYVRSGEPRDKAGAYAIQGIGGLLIERINGSYDNVVGLPLNQLLALFREALGQGVARPVEDG